MEGGIARAVSGNGSSGKLARRGVALLGFPASRACHRRHSLLQQSPLGLAQSTSWRGRRGYRLSPASEFVLGSAALGFVPTPLRANHSLALSGSKPLITLKTRAGGRTWAAISQGMATGSAAARRSPSNRAASSPGCASRFDPSPPALSPTSLTTTHSRSQAEARPRAGLRQSLQPCSSACRGYMSAPHARQQHAVLPAESVLLPQHRLHRLVPQPIPAPGVGGAVELADLRHELHRDAAAEEVGDAPRVALRRGGGWAVPGRGDSWRVGRTHVEVLPVSVRPGVRLVQPLRHGGGRVEVAPVVRLGRGGGARREQRQRGQRQHHHWLAPPSAPFGAHA